MSSFDEREKAFEDKYRHDEELRFKVTARRNRMLGEWAAAEMGMSGPAAASYAASIIEALLGQRGGDAALIGKIKSDLAAKGVNLSEHRIKGELERLARLAREQLMKE